MATVVSWRVARSLLTLRDQIDRAFPERNKASDGTIGDADHQSRTSDHNPWCGPGVVTALDITHDPDRGVDIDRLTDELQSTHDPRIKYVIANRLIMSGNGGPEPWRWRSYSGPNPHTRHFHLSVVCGPLMDDTTPWQLPSLQEDDMALTDDDVRKIWTMGGLIDNIEPAGGWRPATLLSHLEDTQDKMKADIEAIKAKVDTGGVDLETLAARVVDLLAERLQS